MRRCRNLKIFGDPTKSDYATKPDFWRGITRTGDLATIDLDDLIKYIADNYNEKAMDESRTSKLVNDLKNKKEACIEANKEAAIAIIKQQEKIIAENAKEIQKEKEKLVELQEKLVALEEEKAELEGKEHQYAADPTKKSEFAEVEGKLKSNEKKINDVKDNINLLTVYNPSNPGKTIAEHEKQQADFIVQMKKNKRDLLELFNQRNEKLQVENQQENQPVNQQPVNRASQEGGGRFIQPQTAETTETEVAKETTSCNSREDANNILRNLRNSSNQRAMLDDMGYGDIAAMIQYLGPINRLKLRTILKNRADEEGIDIENLKKGELGDLMDASADIEEFMENYGEKTPKEISTFEREVLQKMKYSCLLYDANRGAIRRSFREAFSRNDEVINHLKESMTTYYDGKSKRKQSRFNLMNELRKNVGKSSLKDTPTPVRGSRNSRNPIEKRGVPTR